MIDKKLEDNIKKMERFLEFWSKFHQLYSSKQDNFLSTRTLVNSRFQDLMDSVGMKHSQRLTKGFPVYEILSIENFSGMSDEKLKRIEECWTDSYHFLTSVLNQFKKKKKRIERFNKLVFVTKSFLKRIKNLK